MIIRYKGSDFWGDQEFFLKGHPDDPGVKRRGTVNAYLILAYAKYSSKKLISRWKFLIRFFEFFEEYLNQHSDGAGDASSRLSGPMTATHAGGADGGDHIGALEAADR